MKTACLALVAIGCVAMMRDTTYASPPSQVSDPAISESRVSNKNRQNGDIGATRAISRRELGKRRATRSLGHQARSGEKPAANNPRTNMPGNAMSLQHAGSTKLTGVPDRTVSNRSLPGRSSAGFALSGQQFKNARNRASGLAIIGGPANSTRSTAAAINGTGLNRRSK